jgi:hypothetical protein
MTHIWGSIDPCAYIRGNPPKEEVPVRPEAISAILRKRYYYLVPKAGAKIGLKRSKAYQAVKDGLIPAERHGKLLLVPKAKWDRKVKRLLHAKPRRKAAPAPTTTNQEAADFDEFGRP